MVSQKLFERYLASSIPDDDPDGILEILLTDCAPPILNRVVRKRLGSLYTPLNAAELASEAMLELLSRLRTVREASVPASDLPFDALAAGIAANTVHRFFARRFPERNRLRKSLRYVVGTGDHFDVWLDPNGATVCALAPAGPHALRREGEATANAADIARCIDRLRKQPFPAHPLGPLVLEILRILGRPIDLSRLTALVADVAGVREPAWISTSAGAGRDEEFSEPWAPADPAPSVALRLELRQRLHHLWTEVLLLSARHRNALLLSARAPGGAAVCLLADLGVAPFREIAAALEMTQEELSDLWNRLPLDDHEIAARLGLERQQVINLRCTARERLARREISAGNKGAQSRMEGIGA